jgi:glycosyltransferase involved in cell wall biosynthesis
LHVTVVTPVFNDESAVIRLIGELDAVGAQHNVRLSMVIVDDGSTPELDLSAIQLGRGGVEQIEILQLTHNVGHQRAIAIGLCHVALAGAGDGAIVMDADGEDRPHDILSLVKESKTHGNSIVFAERHRRPETLRFRILYEVYRQVFRILTGRRIKFGNFCFLPNKAITRLVHLPQLWNHFSASLIFSRMPYRSVRIERGRRYIGLSKMSVVSLIAHGLSSMSVFIDSVLVRMIMASAVLGCMLIALMLGAVALRLSVDWVTPGWTTSLIGSLLVILLQSLVLACVSAFVVLQGRAAILATPIRVFKDYVARSIRIRCDERQFQSARI